EYTSYVYFALTVLSVIMGLVLFEKDNLNPAYKLLWLVMFTIFPVSSGLFYLVIGGQKLSKRNKANFEHIARITAETSPDDTLLYDNLQAIDDKLLRCAKYLRQYAIAPIYNDTFSRFFTIGDEFFNPFLDELKKAEKSIFMEYFIISDEGKMWPETLEVLKEKAAAGVDVRIIYDSFGCLFTLPGNYYETLQSFGIKCHPFNAIKPSFHLNDYLILNNRDHRKICVIDGEVGFTGGVNFSDEYINEKQPYGVWKDSAFMIKGPAVYGLTTTFLGMWAYLSGEDVQFEKFKPTISFPNDNDSFVQPFCDSPLDDENVSENAYFNVINTAKKYVYITTPYLVIDYEMLTNLQLAAKSGIDIRLILPGIPDKPMVFMLTQSYYRP
ncbi:MAG: phospholipase D-like domain-containing protein, partial [Oscillospiraceae bacterium]